MEDIYSKSLTERRLEETDFLKSILERTQQNFIDVSRAVAQLDERDAEDRHAAYVEQLQVKSSVVAANKNPLPSLLALPTPYFSGPQATEGAIEAMASPVRQQFAATDRAYVRR